MLQVTGAQFQAVMYPDMCRKQLACQEGHRRIGATKNGMKPSNGNPSIRHYLP